MVRVEAFLPAIEGRTGNVEMATRLFDAMRFSIIEPFQSLFGAFAESVDVGQLPNAHRQGREERDAATAADGRERTARGSSRLGHDGNLL